jgi:hypothetical protein
MIRPLKAITRGSQVYLQIEVRSGTDGMGALYTPLTAPKIRIKDATGTLRVDFTAMVSVSLGVYSYQFATGGSWPLGPIRCSFQIQNSGNTAHTIDQDLCKLVPIT